jgi:hypothetical protein
MIKATKKMLPSMPDGYYQLWSQPHGRISSVFPKQSLIPQLQHYHEAYEPPNPHARFHKGFASLILGFVYQGKSERAMKEGFGEGQRRKERYAKIRKRDSREFQKTIERALYHCSTCKTPYLTLEDLRQHERDTGHGDKLSRSDIRSIRRTGTRGRVK